MSEERKLTEEELAKVVGGVTYYTVKKGDLLSDIAKKFNTTVDQLVKWNHLTNPNYISVGQRLRVA